jgi:hypothetical protein
MAEDHGQEAVSACIRGLCDGSYTEPFTYLLTAKQRDVLDKRFREAKWPAPQLQLVVVSAPAIAHTVQSRIVKDGLTLAEIGNLLAAIFRKDSQLTVNAKYLHQFHLINTRQKLKDGQLAVGCFRVVYSQQAPTEIKLETAYLSVPAKALGLLKRG